jgi:hypothetical protein
MTKTEAKWASRVQAWRASGMTAEAFVEGQGYKAATLRWHASRLRSGAPPRRESSREERGSALVLARVVRVGSPPTALAITVGAARIEVTAGFEPSLLRAVVACLGGCS